MDVSEAKRLKALEDENTKLKRLLADAMLDNAALKRPFGKECMVRLVREGPAGERSHIALYPCSVLPVDVLLLRLPQHDPASDGAVLRRDRDSGRRHAPGRLAVFGYAHLFIP